MSFFGRFWRSQKVDEAIVAAIQANNIQLQAVTQALNDRESPERIREAILSGLQTGNLEKALTSTRDQLDSLNSSLKLSGSRPLSVQTFPIADDFQFEEEKQTAASYSAKIFDSIASDYIAKLNHAHRPVDQAMEKFFALVQEHINNRNDGGKSLGKAMEGLLYCSPKRVIAAFQKNSLEAGWLVVYKFNCLIDLLAKEYPRCRSGIFASRLNYSDVIQISEEIISTLRTTSTVLDDVQRRHDLIEALQGELLSDLQSPQIQQIWDAIGASFKNSLKLYAKDDSWWQTALKATVGNTFITASWAMAVVSAPQAMFQGELARERRVKVFIATSILLKQGWGEWSRMNKEIVIPHLTVLFNLKSDFVRNRLMSITDLITTNGYSIDGLTGKIDSLVKPGNVSRAQNCEATTSVIMLGPEIGKIYGGKVVAVKESGVIVEFMPGESGLVHIGELCVSPVKKVADLYKVGDYIKVKHLGVDKNGNVRLSCKAALEEPGKANTAEDN